ncbi:TetR/AcrR family transcriptional regulator [Vagococcus intermedius]|uniref:TetR family transcriptional regulator C-terminal domain-containing protein n=1 Tax=Vagococcus intermedius TaxID=2991418 RepID=A0AAF0CWK4_9ENTE|nr:TetR-like C-terminal domain-containing protein [Vagococcus intermedius]WEG74253.1 TetR family transcriptional regulator C-terminal domain-containing protein [Vagococcus intermedius]WEG76335.1 TetR family transcriptional regulator C-terminal domain-containing protein [Vagococcus intermedius]
MEQGYVTKQALSLALKELMTHYPLDKIRVGQVTELAHLSRNTFYYHFSDINDLLAWTYDNEVVNGLGRFQDIDTWQEGLMQVLNYTEENRSFCLNTFHSLSRDRLESFLYQITYSMLIKIMTKECFSYQVSPTTRSEIADFYGRAIVAQIIQWLLINLREEKECLVARIERMIVGAIKRITLP